jgi:hypothetical protein
MNLTEKEFSELSDLIYEALEDGLFGDGLIDTIHECITDHIEENIYVLENDDDEDSEED